MAQSAKYANYNIGDWSYGNPTVISWDPITQLTVGRFCSFAPNTTILLGGEHRVDWVTTYPFSILFEDAREFSGHPKTKGDVVVGNDVWVGWGALILSGVTIGDGAVIAAESVITKDVAPYSIVGGNPAKHIRYRFSEATIKSLQELAWWDWPMDKIKEAWPLLLSSDIDELIIKAG